MKRNKVMNILIDDIQFNNLIEAEMGGLYHGSSADFDKFDLSYIKSGYGGTAYGYGIYLTDVLKTANEYSNITAKRKADKIRLRIFSEVWFFCQKSGLTKEYNDFAALRKKLVFANSKKVTKKDYNIWIQLVSGFLEDMSSKIPNEFLKDFNSLVSSIGDKLKNLPLPLRYKVVLKKAGDKFMFLNFDSKIGKEKAKLITDAAKKDNLKYLEVNEDVYGEEIYVIGVENYFSQKEFSEWLMNIGFDGITYVDRFSEKSGDNFNYVIFDPSLINIVEKK